MRCGPAGSFTRTSTAPRRRATRARPLYAVKRPRSVRCGFGSPEFDAEGRYIEAEFASVTVISAYFPSGSSGPERQAAKYRFLDLFYPHLAQLIASGREVILCGDVNIAHREIDLKNWKGNRKNSGFLPEERAWLSRVFDEQGWVDVFRQHRRPARPIHVVEQSRTGLGEERRLADRLPDRHAGRGRARAARRDLHRPALFRPRAADHRIHGTTLTQ